MRERTRKISLVLAVAAGVTAAGCGVSVPMPAGPAFGPPDRGARVRVDQVGYMPEETKHAYLMTSRGPEGIRFEVQNAKGKPVLTGAPGRRTGSWNSSYKSVYVLDLSKLTAKGTYRIEVTGPGVQAGSAKFRVGAGGELFGSLLPKLVRFFQAQRDGSEVLPSVLKRKPSHLADRTATVYEPPEYRRGELVGRLRPAASTQPVDVSGGWADAGDFLKFTHTASYTVAALYYASRANGSAPGAIGVGGEARYGLGWLDKMWDQRSRTLYAQVGIGIGNKETLSDHDVWRLPEADDALQVKPGDPGYAIKHRPVFRAAASGRPISPNLAGRMAAAFALAAQADVRLDPAAARHNLEKAAAIYALADPSPKGALVTAFPHEFYPEDSWQDDMEFGGIELARAAEALGDRRAGQWRKDAAGWAAGYLASDTKGTLGVGDVSALAHADLIADLSRGPTALPVGREELVADLRRQLDDGVARADRDPFRAGADTTESDSAPNSFGLATTARLYRQAGLKGGDGHYDAFGTQQRNWALGANSWGSSFVIGVGTTFPHCPEHQAANLAGSLTGTGDVLEGAVVNGPNAAAAFEDLNAFDGMRACEAGGFEQYDGRGSRFLDHVGAWQSVEPADDYTVSAVLAFALYAGRI